MKTDNHLPLIGEGLDAIITKAQDAYGSNQERLQACLKRYHDAVMLCGSPNIEEREALGGQIILNIRNFGRAFRKQSAKTTKVVRISTRR